MTTRIDLEAHKAAAKIREENDPRQTGGPVNAPSDINDCTDHVKALVRRRNHELANGQPAPELDRMIDGVCRLRDWLVSRRSIAA